MVFPFEVKRSKDPKSQSVKDAEDHLRGIENLKTFTYKELMIATGNFSSDNQVGRGAWGRVYKGKLRDGTKVATKVLHEGAFPRREVFSTEITVLSDIVHENIVKLYGYCAERNEKILVYEYLANNRLSKSLFGCGESNIQMNWKARSKIAIGVARGLAFLNEELQPHIIHRNISSVSILLDEDLTPKITSFGLAAILPANSTHINTCVVGTNGYFDPEYMSSGNLSQRSDVYSFGILLFAIVSGRNPLDPRSLIETMVPLPKTVWRMYRRGKLLKVIDPSLNEDMDVEEAYRFLKVGLLCAQYSSERRPSMSTVVRMLTGERDIDPKDIRHPCLSRTLYSSSTSNPSDSATGFADISTTSNTADSISRQLPSLSPHNDGADSTARQQQLLSPSHDAAAAADSGTERQRQFQSFQADRTRAKHQHAKDRCLSVSFVSERRTERWTSSFVPNPRFCFSPPCDGGFDSDDSFA